MLIRQGLGKEDQTVQKVFRWGERGMAANVATDDKES